MDALRSNVAALGEEEQHGAREVLAALSPVLARVAANVMAEVDLLIDFLDRAAPEIVWVANQWGGESAMVQLARARAIPTLQVQHGTLEHCYAYAPIYSDRFLVWSDLWRSLVNPAEAARVEVVNPGVEARRVTRQAHAGPARITFFTAFPGGRHKPFWNRTIVCHEVLSILRDLAARGHEITVRVHPVEKVSDWRRAWLSHVGPIPRSVRFDKQSALEVILTRTDVGLVFDSTVFLDCLAAGIPVVAIGWLPNPWRSALRNTDRMFFADSMSEAFRLLQTVATTTSRGQMATAAGPAR
jgi:hypothetical protein